MSQEIDLNSIDWMQVCLHLRTHYKPLSRVAIEVGADEGTLCRIARGDTHEPKFKAGIRLLDLHLEHCPDLHGPAIIRG